MVVSGADVGVDGEEGVAAGAVDSGEADAAAESSHSVAGKNALSVASPQGVTTSIPDEPLLTTAL